MKASNRGKGLCIELAINIFGVALSYWVDYGMSFVDNDSQFRFPIAFQVFFAVLTFAGILLLPESPRWLVAHDRHDEAKQILWSIQPDARDIDIDDPKLNRDIAEIVYAIQEEREASSGGSFRTMLKNGEQKFLYRTLLGIGGQFMQQISGINLITYVWSSSNLFLHPSNVSFFSTRPSFSKNPLAFHIICPSFLPALMELPTFFPRWSLFGLSTDWVVESSCFLLLPVSVLVWLS